ncbi:ABC transporter permease [Citrobacter sp. R56]|nr:ABC transporter permease [Citrobacter sp. R56]
MENCGIPVVTEHKSSGELNNRYGMSGLQTLSETVEDLRLLGRRSVLALLGIAVGCAAVVALLNIGYNAQKEALSIFHGMGSDLLIADIQQATGTQESLYRFTSDIDRKSLQRDLPNIKAASVIVPSNTLARLNGKSANVIVVGTSADYPIVLNLRLAAGRFLSDFDRHNTYAVIGANIAEQWPGVSIGSNIQLGGYLFKVVGILKKQEQNPLVPISTNDAVILPAAGMRRVTPYAQITGIVARNADSETLTGSASELQEWLSQRLPDTEINVQIPQMLLESINHQSRLFTWLLAGLGVIALLVGGVGVMNVMVMNVSERRKEIGVRMALGARPRDITLLFLLEALILALIGALTGAITGIGLAWLFVHLSGWSEFALSVSSLPLGVISSIGTGLFFGLSPAFSAARLEPVEALRDA